MGIKRNVLAASCALLLMNIAHAANHYIRAGANGNNSGSDWNNAYPNVPNSLVRGDTYYIAGGTYGGHVFNDPISGTLSITVKKATVSDHGTETGWSSTYGSTQAVFTGWQIYSDYYQFDGAQRNSDWYLGNTSQYGIRVGNTRIDDGAGKGADNVTFRKIDFHGGGRDTGNADDVIYGLTGNSQMTFSECALHDSDRTIFLMRGNWQNLLIEKSYLARNTSTPANHGELMSMTDSTNLVVRNNVMVDIEGTAFIAGINGGVANNLQAYGNVVYHTAAYIADTGRKTGHNWGVSAFIYIANDASNNNSGNDFKVYNNTLSDIQGLWSGVIIQKGTGNEVRNNIWYNSVRTNNSFSGTIGSNWYYNTQADGDSTSSKVVCTSNCDIFANRSAGNFHLKLAVASGSSMASPFNVDMDGVVRGSDGVYDRGAYEYGGNSNSDTQAPTATITSPTNGSILPVGQSVVLAANASDNVGVSKVEFYINGNLRCTASTAPYTCTISGPKRSGKTFQIQAKAYDAANNVGNSSIVTATSK